MKPDEEPYANEDGISVPDDESYGNEDGIPTQDDESYEKEETDDGRKMKNE